jgi:hypothetical protein
MSRLRHEAGQTVVLIAVLLPLFLGLGAIAVDIGYWYVVKKTTQDAADAAALAAAAELPNDVAVRQAASTYVRANLPDASWQVEYPYVPRVPAGPPPPAGALEPPPTVDGAADPSRVEVTVEKRADTFFGRIFGFISPLIRSRAVAERLPGDDNLAIFADSDDCDDGLEFSAPDVKVNGHIHSNGQFRISVGPFWAADGTFNDAQCRATKDEHAESLFGDGPDFLPREGELRPWPMWFTPQEFGWTNGCTYTGETIRISNGEVLLTGPDRSISYDAVIPSGTYCARESFVLDASDVRGAITALAPAIAVDGEDLRLTPYSRNVLFFAVPNTDNTSNDGPPPGVELSCVPADGGDMVLAGSGHRWSGVIFNPCGRTVVNVGSGESGGPAFEGAIIADRIRVVGHGFEMTGRGDFEYSTALVE